MVVPIEVDTRRLHRVGADVLVTGFFAPEGPLRGPAAWADWRLCGLLTEALQQGRLGAAATTATLAPTEGRLQAPWVLGLGLGERSGFGELPLRDAVAAAVSRVVALRVGRLALAFPSESEMGLTCERAAVAGLSGLAAALARRPAALHVRWVVSEAEAAGLRDGLRFAAARLDSPELSFRIGEGPLAPPEPASAERAPASTPPAPAFRPRTA